jgi:hypothetical protein
MEHYIWEDYNGTKLNNMMKNKIKKIVIYLATQLIHGVGWILRWGELGWGWGVNWMKIGKNFNLNSCRLSSHLFMPPLFEIEHCLIAGRAGFVGLFIELFCIDCLNIADTNNHRCRPRKDNRHKKYRFLVSATLGRPTPKMVSLYWAQSSVLKT